MNSIVRKLRGAVGTAITWAGAWAVAGGAFLGGLSLVTDLGGEVFWRAAGPFIALAAGSGLIAGTVFSVVLGTVYRNRRIGDLSVGRMAAWGAGAGLLLPAALIGVGAAVGIPLEAAEVASTLLGIGALGAMTAGGTIKVAQAADGDLEPPDLDDLLDSGG